MLQVFDHLDHGVWLVEDGGDHQGLVDHGAGHFPDPLPLPLQPLHPHPSLGIPATYSGLVKVKTSEEG